MKRRTLRYIVYAPLHWSDINETETITFYLYEWPSGRREYEVLTYGYAKLYEKHKDLKPYRTMVKPWIDYADVPGLKPFEVAESEVKFVTIPKYDETWIDKIYNAYCRIKGRHLRELSHEDFEKLLL